MDGSWNVRTRPLRAILSTAVEVISSPAKITEPALALEKPEITLSKVLFSATVRSKKANNFACCHLDIDAFQNLVLAE